MCAEPPVREGWAARLRARHRAWSSRSISNRITATAVALTMAVAVALGATSYVAIRYLVTRVIASNLDTHARLIEQEFTSSVEALSRDASNLAGNSFVANGIVDSHGRDAYLLPFLREHRAPVAATALVVLCDFEGRAIVSSPDARPAALDLRVVRAALSGGRPAAEVVDANGTVTLTIAYPIVFPPTRSVEGALAVSVDLTELFARIASGILDGGTSAGLALGGAVVQVPDRSARDTAIRVERTIRLAAPLDRLGPRLLVAEGAAALAPLRWVLLAYVLIGAVTLLAVIRAARFHAGRLTARLASLSRAASEIASGAPAEPPLADRGSDEVDMLARAFATTAGKLRAAQDDLERRVRERTAQLQQREEELEQSRSHLALAMESSVLGEWEWDVASGRTRYGARWPALLGYGLEDVEPTFAAWVRLVHRDDVPRVHAEVVAHVKGETTGIETEYRLRAKDGSWKWVHTRAKVVARTADGRALRMAGTHADVTRRREAEERLREAHAANERLIADLQASEERLRLALASGTHVEWDWDVARDRFSHGPSWWDMLGVDRGSVPDTIAGWKSVVHPEDLDRAWAALEECVSGRTLEYAGHYRIRSGDGGWRWVRSRGRIVSRAPDGRALRIAGTRTDITELNTLQEKLLAATRLASVGTLAAGVAHEINNPLAWVTANVAFALEELASPGEGWDGASVRVALAEAREGAERIAAIVKSMRSLGRPEQAGAASDVDVGAELESAIQMVRNQLVQRAALDVRIADDLPLTRAPTHELGRVFLNLLVNAAQAIPEGRADEHRIGVVALRSPGGAVVEISDTGAGMSKEIRDRIFDAFFTTKPVGVGTGLGLTMARTIVEAAGGTIEVESEPGRGSTFRVALPTWRPGGPPRRSAAPAAASASTPG